MENNSVLLIRLQDLLHRLRSSRNSRLHLIREIRKKVTTFELLLHKVLNLELYLEKVPGTSFQTALGLGFGSNETTYAEPQKIPPPPPPIFQNDITRPFSYSQSKALRDLVLLLRRNPRDLAKILVAVSFANEEVKGGNSDKKIAWSSLDTDRICRMVVFDIYEPEISHRELIILIEEVLTSSYHGFSKGTRKGSRSMSPEAELLRPNTMTALLLKHYLNRFGVKYLKDVLRPTISLILNDDSLDLEFSGLNSPKASHSHTSDPQTVEEVKTLENSHKDLLNICEIVLNSIAKSISIIPFGIRYIGSILVSLSSIKSEAKLNVLGDFLFLHFVVNSFWNPGILSDISPISPSGRANLEAVGTILLKLISGSRFSTFDDQLKSINKFLDSWQPRITKVLEDILKIAPFDSYFTETELSIAQSSKVCAFALVPREILILRRALEFESILLHEETAQEIKGICSRLGDLSNIPDSGVYTIITVDIPALEFDSDKSVPITMANEKTSDGVYFSSHELKAIDVLQSAISSVKPMRVNSACSQTVEFLEDQAKQYQLQGDPSKFAMLMECILILKNNVSIENRTDDYLPFLSAQIQATELILKSENEENVASNLLSVDHYISVLIEQLKLREDYCINCLRVSRIREIISLLYSRINYFNSQLSNRYMKMQRYACTGLKNQDLDLLVCRRCVIVSEKQKEALEFSLNECVRVFELKQYANEVFQYVLPVDLSSKQKSSLIISGESMKGELLNYFIMNSYKNVFIYCEREEAALSRKIKQLNYCVQNFSDFLLLMENEGPTDQESITDASPIIQHSAGKSYLSTRSIEIAIDILKDIKKPGTLKEKIQALISCREVLISILSLSPMTSVDDYMPLLSYVIMKANPDGLLSIINLLKIQYPGNSTVKAFLDFCTAIKYIMKIRRPVYSIQLYSLRNRLIQHEGYKAVFVDAVIDRLLFDFLDQISKDVVGNDVDFSNLSISLTSYSNEQAEEGLRVQPLLIPEEIDLSKFETFIIRVVSMVEPLIQEFRADVDSCIESLIFNSFDMDKVKKALNLNNVSKA